MDKHPKTTHPGTGKAETQQTVDLLGQMLDNATHCGGECEKPTEKSGLKKHPAPKTPGKE